jgi:nucleoside-diphosphate-sugar epimerase
LPVYGEGRQTRSLCYVSDAVEGIALLGAALGYHEPVNIGRPDEVTMLELAQVVLQVVGSPSAIEFRPLPGEDPPRRCPDVTRATEVLGWRAQFELGLGIGLMAEAMSAERGQVGVA